MRCFIAFDLNDQVKKALEKMIVSLRRKGGNIRWVKPHNLHLTLKFLGEVPEEQVPGIEQAMLAAAVPHPAFHFQVRGSGVFPRSGRPRVLWVGIELQAALSQVQRGLEDELIKLGFPREKREFAPHLTIGRVRSGAGLKPILTDLSLWKDSSFGSVRADTLVLYQSTLKPAGAEYTALFKAALS